MSCGPTTSWCGNVRAGEPFVRGRDCERCWLMTHSAPHRKNWKVEGPAVEVCHPPPPPPKLTGRAPLPARLRPCASLGAKAKANCGCTDRHCLKGHGVVRHLAECQTCDGYEPRPPTATGSPPGREDTPKK